MALTAEQLQKYWDANPQALEQAIASNPGMFGLTSQTSPTTNGMGDDGFQIGAAQPAPDLYTGVTGAATQRDATQPVGMLSVSPLEQVRAQNQAYNAANPMPEGFTPPPMFSYQGAVNPMNNMLPGETTADWIARNALQGTENRTSQFDLGKVYEVGNTAGGIKQTGDFGISPEVNQAVLEEFNRIDQEYTNSVSAFLRGEDVEIGERPSYGQVLQELTGLPESYETEDGRLFKFNPVTGSYTGAMYREPSLSAKLISSAPAIIGAATGNPWLAAAGSGLSTANQGGDLEDVLKAAGTSYITSGVLDQYMPPAYSAQNVGGSFISGTTNDIISQALTTGDVDIGDALKAGAIKTGFDVVKDAFQDARQTSDLGEMLEEGLTVDGAYLSPEQLRDTVQNTTDLYGLLGKDGLFAKLGFEIDELPTGYAGKLLDFISSSPERTTATIDGKEYRVISYQGDTVALDASGNIDPNITVDDISRAASAGNVKMTTRTGILPAVDYSRYDERFFDLTTPRSSMAPQSGIWYSPQAASGSYVGVLGNQTNSGEGSLPSSGATTQQPVREQVDDIISSLPEDVVNSVPPDVKEEIDDILKDSEPDGDLINGTVPGDDEELTLGGGGYGDITLPSGSIDTTLPSADVTTLPSTGGSIVDTVSTGSIENTLPSSGGGGGGLPSAPKGMMGMSPKDAEDFMSGITYILPIIQQLNIPLEDFMAMWMNRK